MVPVAALTTPDTIVLIACAVLGIRGAIKGFAWQSVRTVGLIAALWGATIFHERIGAWMDDTFGFIPSVAAPIVAWLLILVAIILLGTYFAHLARGMVRTASLSGLDRMLGLALGAVMGLVFSAITFVVWGKFTGEEELRETLKGSVSARYMALSIEVLEPFFPDSVRSRFDEALDAVDKAADAPGVHTTAPEGG